MIKKIGLFALLACISLNTFSQSISIDALSKAALNASIKRGATKSGEGYLTDKAYNAFKEDPLGVGMLAAGAGAIYVGVKNIKENAQINQQAQAYEQELLDNPDNYQNLLNKLKNIPYGEYIRKKAGIGSEFFAKQMDTENTTAYKEALSMIDKALNLVEENPQWQNDYKDYRNKIWNQYYLMSLAIDESSTDFQDALDKIDPKLLSAEQLASIKELNKQKEENNNNLSCKNPTYRYIVYNDLIKNKNKDFRKTITGKLVENITVPSQLNGILRNNLEEFDVNAYTRLINQANPSDRMQHDHIPSGAALVANFALKKILGSPGYLKTNASTIELSDNLHANGRTFRNKNNKDQIKEDAKDLKIAVRKDAATYLVTMFITLRNDGKKYDANDLKTYIKSIMVLHERNKLLCLYD